MSYSPPQVYAMQIGAGRGPAPIVHERLALLAAAGTAGTARGTTCTTAARLLRLRALLTTAATAAGRLPVAAAALASATHAFAAALASATHAFARPFARTHRGAVTCPLARTDVGIGPSADGGATAHAVTTNADAYAVADHEAGTRYDDNAATTTAPAMAETMAMTEAATVHRLGHIELLSGDPRAGRSGTRHRFGARCYQKADGEARRSGQYD
jgi:hypothetical protein